MHKETTKESVASASRLKKLMEQSLAVMREGKAAAAATQTKTGTLSRRALPLHMNAAYLQNGALVDAADALAALWKISKPANHRRRPSFQSHPRTVSCN